MLNLIVAIFLPSCQSVTAMRLGSFVPGGGSYGVGSGFSIMQAFQNHKGLADSVATINQLGLLGEKYVEISPGVDTQRFFKDGEEIVGKDPISQSDLSERVMDVAGKMEKAVVNGLLKPENIESVSQSLASLSRMSDGVSSTRTICKRDVI